ncbi:MAG: hypothetical protein HY783_03285, partial [Chloroflexi bacterium]|nr:hypothetical protein [Chloroflexota bacterium]
GKIDDLKAFLAALVERYDGDGIQDAPGSPVVRYWTFYAEPDNGSEAYAAGGKGWWGHNGSGYADLLHQIQLAIKATDPQAKVMIGGLAYDWFEESGGPFVKTFLDDVLAAGGGQYIDLMPFHYYPINPAWNNIGDKATAIRGVFQGKGVSAPPMFSPEMGYWSDAAANSSEELQANRLVKIYVNGLAASLQNMCWFAVFDDGPGTEAHGLFWNRDLTQPKASYWTYKTMTQELAGARFNRTLGPGDFQQGGMEGYEFRLPSGKTKGVIWTTDGATKRMLFPFPGLRVVDKNKYNPDGSPNASATRIIYDGQAGDLDGQGGNGVTIEIGPSPVYVELYP